MVYFSLQAINTQEDMFIRQKNFLGELTPIITALDKADATFSWEGEGQGNYGDEGRLRSFTYPTHYLRHQDSRIKLHQDLLLSTQFQNDSTFIIRESLAGTGGMSIESKNFPGRYIRHRNSQLYLEPVYSQSDREDATFLLTQALIFTETNTNTNTNTMRPLRWNGYHYF